MSRRTAARYFALCVVQMCASAALVTALYAWMPISETLAKVCVDVLLFLVSFQIQRRWIFT